MKYKYLIFIVGFFAFSGSLSANSFCLKNRQNVTEPPIKKQKYLVEQPAVPKKAIQPVTIPTSGYIFKFGLGISQVAYDDNTLKIEAEGVKNWNRSISTSLSLGYGYVDPERLQIGSHRTGTVQAEFFNVDLNVFHTSYAFNDRFAFKIGGCLSSMYLNHLYRSEYIYSPNGDLTINNRRDKNVLLGGGVLLDHEYALSDKYVIGLKGLAKLYTKSRGELGLQLKFGVRL